MKKRSCSSPRFVSSLDEMRALKSSLKWWVFLPVTPVIFLLLLDGAYAVLSYFRLYWLASVIDAVTIFVTAVPLALYWAISTVFLGVGSSTPYPLQLTALVAVALLFCAGLFVLHVIFTIAFRRRPHHYL